MRTKNKTLEITNKDVSLIMLALTPLELGEKEASARRRFLKLIREAEEARKTKLTELQEKFVAKDTKGNKVIVENQYQFTPDKKKIFTKEVEKLREAVVEISYDGNEQDLEVCIGILEDEVKKETEKANGKFTTDAYEYIESLKEIIQSLK